MASCSSQSLQSSACLPTSSVPDARQFAARRVIRSRLLRNRPSAEPRFGFWRWMLVRRSRLPRLNLEDLSEHQLRDLGFIDGRAVQPRDPLRD